MKDEYLGDGVYASIDYGDIVLDLRGQDDTTRIVLEGSVLRALIAFAQKNGVLGQPRQDHDG